LKRKTVAIIALAALGVLAAWALISARLPASMQIVPTLAGAYPEGGAGLYLRTVGLAAAASVMALAMALPAGLYLGQRGSATLAGAALVPVFIPPHVAAFVWRMLLERIFPAGPAFNFAGAAWTLAALYWPVIAAPVAAGVYLRGNRLEQELATLMTPRAFFWRGLLGGLAPAATVGTGVFFLLAISNYGVPLTWNVPAQTIAVFARLAAFWSPGEALALSTPLAATAGLVCLAAILWAARRPHGFDLGGARTAQGAARSNGALGLVTAGTLLVTAVLPFLVLAATPGALRFSSGDIAAGKAPFFWGLALAALGATGATALGLILSGAAGQRKAAAAAIEFAGLVLLFAPAAVLCVLLAGAMNREGWVGRVYDSLAIFPVAYGLRYFYIPWKLARMTSFYEGPERRDLGRMLGLGAATRANLALSGALRPAAAAGWIMVFALTLGELEIATFLAQPGRQPAGVFLDNLMHYGRSAALAQWSLALVAAEASAAWMLFRMGLRECRQLNASN